MMTQEIRENRKRIARTTLAVGPVSRKKARREVPPGRFSAVTG
jgi:hypothetical protein